MLFGNEKLFAEARDAKLGRITLAPALAALRNEVSTTFSVRVVHVVYDAIDIGPSATRPRLNLILETDADREAIHENRFTIRRSVKGHVLNRFVRLAEQLEPGRYDTDDVLLITDSFEDECLVRACAQFRERDKHRVIEEFAAARIWAIDGFSRSIVVFLPTDADVRKASKDGTVKRIAARCFDLVRGHDEFGYLTEANFQLKFDSKANLDRNFRGNLYLYFK